MDNSETRVVIKMPAEIKIDLVQANELKHYELFQWLVILLLPIASGFWTAYFTNGKKAELLWSALAFTVISLLFVVLAYWYRKKVFQGNIQKTTTLDNFKNNKNKDLININKTLCKKEQQQNRKSKKKEILKKLRK